MAKCQCRGCRGLITSNDCPWCGTQNTGGQPCDKLCAKNYKNKLKVWEREGWTQEDELPNVVF